MGSCHKLCQHLYIFDILFPPLLNLTLWSFARFCYRFNFLHHFFSRFLFLSIAIRLETRVLRRRRRVEQSTVSHIFTFLLEGLSRGDIEVVGATCRFTHLDLGYATGAHRRFTPDKTVFVGSVVTIGYILPLWSFFPIHNLLVSSLRMNPVRASLFLMPTGFHF